MRPGLRLLGSCDFQDLTCRHRWHATTFDTRKIVDLYCSSPTRCKPTIVSNGESLVILAWTAQHWGVLPGHQEYRPKFN
jgi:hypothetical protein